MSTLQIPPTEFDPTTLDDIRKEVAYIGKNWERFDSLELRQDLQAVFMKLIDYLEDREQDSRNASG